MKMRKIMASILALTTAFGGLLATGCNREQGEEIDTSKSQLNVGVFNAGYGRVWADNAAAAFEEMYANTSFEDGKVGVQVIIDAKKAEFSATSLKPNMQYYENAIYFLNQHDYAGFITDGSLADITETVNEKVYDENGDLAAVSGKAGTQSILSRMNEDLSGRREVQGKYYGVPWASFYSSIIYDADLFNDRALYYKADGTIGATQADIDAGECGVGPDGTLGTPDDGMPQTWGEFLDLMDKMANEEQIIPFTWAGETTYQKWYAYENVWANYEGADNFRLNYTMKDHESNPEVVAEQEGRKAGIQFFYDIISDAANYSSNVKKLGYQEAQTEYITSINADKPIAFFMEGGYWENEAIGTFNNMALTEPEKGYGKRDFRHFPIPNFTNVQGITDQAVTNDKEVLLGRGTNSLICITAKNASKNPDVQLKLAKLFLQFTLSRGQLAAFTRDTGGCFGLYDYAPNAEELKQYTKYAQSVQAYISDGAKVVNETLFSGFWKDNQTVYEGDWRFLVKDGTSFTDPASLFLNKAGSYTVQTAYDACVKSAKACLAKVK